MQNIFVMLINWQELQLNIERLFSLVFAKVYFKFKARPHLSWYYIFVDLNLHAQYGADMSIVTNTAYNQIVDINLVIVSIHGTGIANFIDFVIRIFVDTVGSSEKSAHDGKKQE